MSPHVGYESPTSVPALLPFPPHFFAFLPHSFQMRNMFTYSGVDTALMVRKSGLDVKVKVDNGITRSELPLVVECSVRGTCSHPHTECEPCFRSEPSCRRSAQLGVCGGRQLE